MTNHPIASPEISYAASQLRVGATRHARTRGFSLVDVMIGSVMLAIGLAVIISLNSRSLANQVEGERQLTASWLADELLSMVMVDGPVDFPKLNDVSGQFEEPFEDFRYDVDIEDKGISEPFLVTALVKWDGAGGERKVQVQTLIAERGGEPGEPRAPAEMIDREERWMEMEDDSQ
jgi:general secretion pathway protein I